MIDGWLTPRTLLWNGGLGPSNRFSVRELNGSTGPEHLGDAKFIKLYVSPRSEGAQRSGKCDLSKLIVTIASAAVGATVAVVAAAAGVAGQLVKAAVPTLFVGILAVALVVVAVVAIIILSGCVSTAQPGSSAGPDQAASATDTAAPAPAANTATPTTAPESSTPIPTATTGAPTAEPKSEPDYEIVTLLPPDAIPAISDPTFVSADEADDQYDHDELVLGVEIDGDARAYSIPLLSRHEIVNDVVGGKPIAVTW